MEWKEYPLEIPRENSRCYVTDTTHWFTCYLAMFRSKRFWVFDPGRQRELEIPVTHFIQLPVSPKPMDEYWIESATQRELDEDDE